MKFILQILLIFLIATIALSRESIDFLENARVGNSSKVREMLEQGTDPNSTNEVGQTALHLSAMEGRIDVVRLLINSKADVNRGDHTSITPMMLAAGRDRLEIIQEFIHAGANVNAVSVDGSSALTSAAGIADKEVIKLLVQAGANVNQKTKSLRTPLMIASMDGKTDNARLLIGAGAEIEAKDFEGSTALMLAAEYGKEEIVAFLKSKNAKLNTRNFHGDTAYTLASRNDHGAVSRLLVPFRNAPSNVSETLLGAAERGDLSFVIMLLRNGANANTRDHELNTPLLLASKSARDFSGVTSKDIKTDKRIEYPSITSYEEIIRLLLINGADVNVMNRNGETPLHWASEYSIAYLLISSHANVNVVTKQGITPLIWSCISFKKEIASLYLQHGAKVDMQDQFGYSALHYAVRTRLLELVRMIINAGADKNLKNKDGETPRDIALKMNATEIADLLR